MNSETWNCVTFVWYSDIREESGAQQVAHEVRGAQDQPQEGSKMDRSGQFNGVIFRSFWCPWGVLGGFWGGPGGVHASH